MPESVRLVGAASSRDSNLNDRGWKPLQRINLPARKKSFPDGHAAIDKHAPMGSARVIQFFSQSSYTLRLGFNHFRTGSDHAAALRFESYKPFSD
jgi:hypothetical protein